MNNHIELATCSYQEFQPTMGAPIRTTVGNPRFKLGYSLAGHALTITPLRGMLNLPLDAYTLAYRRRLAEVGVGRIRRELEQLTTGHPGQRLRLVLLCFDRLDQPGKWCHRTIFSQWWYEQTGQLVPELGAKPPAPTPTLFDS